MQLLTTTHGLTVSVESPSAGHGVSPAPSPIGVPSPRAAILPTPGQCHRPLIYPCLCVLLPQAAVPALIGLSGELQSFFKPDFTCHLSQPLLDLHLLWRCCLSNRYSFFKSYLTPWWNVFPTVVYEPPEGRIYVLISQDLAQCLWE